MEPADLNPRPPTEDDSLDALLRRPLPPLADHGFTRNVLATLPASATTRTPARAPLPRGLFIALGTAAGFGLAALGIESMQALVSDWTPIASTVHQTTASLNEPTTLMALAIAGASLIYAFFFTQPRSLR